MDVHGEVTVLIALDESPVSRRAAREAARLFGAARTRFLVVNVARTPASWIPVGGFGLVSVPPPGWEEKMLLPDEDELARQAEEVGVTDPEILSEVGDPVDAICTAAEEHDADVIVVGSHHKSFLARIVSPSVSAGVARGTDRPVLIVSDRTVGGQTGQQ